MPLGPLKTVHVFWIAGMSCDGCTVEAGDEFIQPMKDARLPGEGRNDM
ncbi:MAG: hypothetical protein ACR2GK_01925 [Gemmatimonadaceae bacterium]